MAQRVSESLLPVLRAHLLWQSVAEQRVSEQSECDHAQDCLNKYTDGSKPFCQTKGKNHCTNGVRATGSEFESVNLCAPQCARRIP